MYYGEVAEWLKATDCKSVKSLVRIQPSPPVLLPSSCWQNIGLQNRRARIVTVGGSQ
jgi:hypothetical protein